MNKSKARSRYIQNSMPFRPGTTVVVQDEDSHLNGKYGIVLPVDEQYIKGLKEVGMSQLIGKTIPVDFHQRLFVRRGMDGNAVTTHNLFGRLKGHTGFLMMPYQIRKADS